MDILEAFVFNGVSHNITILWEDETPLFRGSEIGDILEIKNIKSSTINYDEDEKILQTVGGLQKVLFLTKIGLYRLLMTSRKPIAKPFQKWVCKLLVNIRDKLNLNNQCFHEAIKKEAEKCNILNEQAIHNVLISAYAKKPVVYFGKIKNIGDKILIKIGKTTDIYTRSYGLKQELKSLRLFKVIECSMNVQFEKFLHKHPMIKQFKYNDVLYESKSNKVFLVSQEQCDQILDIANCNIINFINQPLITNQIEIEKIIQKIEEQINNSKETIIDSKSSTVEHETYCYENHVVINHRNYTQVRGDKIQIYNPETKALVKTFESLIDATRNHDYMQDSSRNLILNAIKNNILYKNFRWLKLERKFPDDTIQELPETKESHQIKKGFVAMLNLERNRIEQVFPNQKTAAENRKFKGCAPISKAIKMKSQSGGHYFEMWFDCDQGLKDDYLTRASLPSKVKMSNAIIVEKLNPVTKMVIQTYSSMEEVLKEHKTTRGKLKEAAENDYIICAYKWNIIK